MEDFSWNENSRMNIENVEPNLSNVTIRSSKEDPNYSFCGEARGDVHRLHCDY